jgi:hypothetical protein
MNLDKMKDEFDMLADGFVSFNSVPEDKKLSKRRDLHAFILLSNLFPDGKSDIVASAEHDIIYLGVDLEELAKVATEDIIYQLVACGVFMDSDSLAMFV